MASKVLRVTIRLAETTASVYSRVTTQAEIVPYNYNVLNILQQATHLLTPPNLQSVTETA